MEILKLKGSRREVGRQYGEACREGFHALHAQAAEAASRESCTSNWYDDIHRMLESIGHHFPGYLEEMAGAAEGAKLTLDAVLLNHRLFLAARHLDDACCTNIAFLAPSVPVFGKNLDLSPNPDRDYVIRDVTYEDGVRIVHSVVVGEITARDTCMNGHGLTLGGSSVGSVFQQTLDHPPIEAGLYEMLYSCATVGEAIRFLRRYPYVGKGYNLVLVDKRGQGVVFECACPLTQIRHPKPGQDAIFCTNTYRLDSLLHADLRPPVGKVYSERRYRYLERKLFESRIPRTVEQIKALLAAHGPDGGLCRPIDRDDPSKTHMSVVTLPRERAFWFTDGSPCTMPYQLVV
jgi:isopenicillin-N N-acyltransferase-like protein